MDNVIKWAKRSNFYSKILKSSSFEELIQMRFFTYKNMLREKPYDFLAVPRKNVRLIFSSSGTTGKPTLSFYTESDLGIIDELAKKTMNRIGVFEGEVGIVNAPFEMAMPGYCMLRMLLLSKAVAIPTGVFLLNPHELWNLIQQSKVSIYMGYPSAILEIIEENRNNLSSNLKKIILGAEPISLPRKRQIEKLLNADVYDTFGLSEIFAPLGGECKTKNGMHIATNHVYVEIVDPVTKEPAKAKNCTKKGILVVTALTREGMPLIRYWTNDYVVCSFDICECGERSPRIWFKDKMENIIYINGEVISSQDFETILLEHDNIYEYYIKLYGTGDISMCNILVETGGRLSYKEISEINNKIRKRMGIKSGIRQVKIKEIPRIKPKRKRLIDCRIRNDGTRN